MIDDRECGLSTENVECRFDFFDGLLYNYSVKEKNYIIYER